MLEYPDDADTGGDFFSPKKLDESKTVSLNIRKAKRRATMFPGLE